MSSRIEEPPDGLVAVDEDTLLRRLDEWDRNLVAVARSFCTEKDGPDARGHSKRPCEGCLKGARHVTEFWFMAMLTKARAVKQRAEKEGVDLPMVDLYQGLFIASSLLDPATSVALPDWGAA